MGYIGLCLQPNYLILWGVVSYYDLDNGLFQLDIHNCLIQSTSFVHRDKRTDGFDIDTQTRSFQTFLFVVWFPSLLRPVHYPLSSKWKSRNHDQEKFYLCIKTPLKNSVYKSILSIVSFKHEPYFNNPLPNSSRYLMTSRWSTVLNNLPRKDRKNSFTSSFVTEIDTF